MSTTQLPVSSSADDHLQTRDCQLVNTRTTVTPENFNPLSHYDITGRHYMAADNTTRFGGKTETRIKLENMPQVIIIDGDTR